MSYSVINIFYQAVHALSVSKPCDFFNKHYFPSSWYKQGLVVYSGTQCKLCFWLRDNSGSLMKSLNYACHFMMNSGPSLFHTRPTTHTSTYHHKLLRQWQPCFHVFCSAHIFSKPLFIHNHKLYYWVKVKCDSTLPVVLSLMLSGVLYTPPLLCLPYELLEEVLSLDLR